MTLKAEGPCEVTAAMIETGHDVEIMNPDLVICTLDKDAVLNMELTVGTGKGYVPASANRPEDCPIGLIPVDSIFSPVTRAVYQIDNARVGQITNYDKLSLTVETNGTVSPEDAVALAARILQEQLKLFVNFEEPEEDVETEKKDELPFNRNLLRKVDILLAQRLRQLRNRIQPVHSGHGRRLRTGVLQAGDDGLRGQGQTSQLQPGPQAVQERGGQGQHRLHLHGR